MMKRVIVTALAVAGCEATGVATSTSVMRAHGNPMRKVVTMLQSISKKVENEGKEAEDLFDKFMCECNKQSAALTKQIETAESKGSDTAAALEAGKGQQEQLTQDLKDAKADRAAAKEAIAQATGIRQKEAKTFAAMKAESDANIASMGEAIGALRAGTGGSFLQTGAAQTLRNLVQNKQDLFDGNTRDAVQAFLQDGTSGTGEIIGMLEQLKEEMTGDLAAATKAEGEAVETYNQLVAAKTKEFEALQASIEEKMTRLGELGVANAELSNSGGDTGDALADDKKSLADLKVSCAKRAEEWEVEKKTRAEELLALADVIKMLNDDDALELFKKALPSAASASSFMQVTVSTSMVRARALAVVHEAQKKHHKSTGLDFIALAIHGKKVGFEKVIALIDKMAANLKDDQKADDDKKAYCAAEFDSADDQKKALERKVSDAETAIADAKETVASLVDEIAALKAGIKDLDLDVAAATAQRQNENAIFKQTLAENSAAKELIGMAKNRLNKFYNPTLYKAPPKRELSEEDRIAVNMGGTAPPTPAPGGIAGTGISASFVQVAMHTQSADAEAVQKKTQESGGVIAMMDLLTKDLDNQITVGTTEEKNAQEDYETAMADAATKRTADAKLLEDKEGAKAETDDALQGHVDNKAATGQELQGTMQYIASLHGDCDWLLKYYDQRKEARADEIDAMMKAKDVLNGADYSLLQVTHSHSLRGARK
jgi:hypothetical protein